MGETHEVDIVAPPGVPVNVHLAVAVPMRVLVSQTACALGSLAVGVIGCVTMLNAGHDGFAMLAFLLGVLGMHTKYDGKTGGYET